MKELSLYILDIAQNSFAAGAILTEVLVDETETQARITVRDDGCGMSEQATEKVFDPFYSTKNKKTGLGIPFFKLAAELTGGEVKIESSDRATEHGTTVIGVFHKDHIDCPPLGDMVSTVCLLAMGCGDGDLFFLHKIGGEEKVRLDTRALRSILRETPLSHPEIQLWMRKYVKQQYEK